LTKLFILLFAIELASPHGLEIQKFSSGIREMRKWFEDGGGIKIKINN